MEEKNKNFTRTDCRTSVIIANVLGAFTTTLHFFFSRVGLKIFTTYEKNLNNNNNKRLYPTENRLKSISDVGILKKK